jgi:hypothetical protein
MCNFDSFEGFFHFPAFCGLRFGRKFGPAGSKVLYHPLEELQRAVKYFTAR